MLKKILSGWMKTANTDDEETKVENLPKHEQARALVEQIASRMGTRRPFNPVRASGVLLHCVNTDVIGFTERLNDYAGKIELDETLTRADCFAEVKEVTLDQFFTDKDGLYIPLAAFDGFVASCQRLFTALDHGELRDNPNVEYSIRLMGKCFSSIQNVCKAVEEASS